MREIFATICLAGSIQAFLLCVVLLVKKNNRRANGFLSLVMLFLAIDAFELYLGARGLMAAPRPYQLSVIPYSLIFGPSMFLYVVFLTARLQAFPKKYLLLYGPFAAALAVNMFVLFYGNTFPVPRAVIYVDMAINGGGLIFEALFYALSLVLLQKYIGRLKDYFSAIDALKLSFLRVGLIFLILVVSLIFLSLVSDGYVRRQYKLPDVIAVLSSVGLGFGIAFLAMIQPEIFNRVRLMERAVPHEETASGPRYEKLRLPAPEEESHVRKLRAYMTEHKPYLREELTLQDMADELSLSTHHLSMILNIHFKQNFYNFVNSYRIADVKEKLLHPDFKNQNILSIAYSAGFNSKSTFNTMFKKFTGKTPREYRADLFM
ncbi:MAG: hypothetical protein CVV44_18950 [Spirochaetae bacterium HGW-Spirochaetae-1]|jgi:AraC-like DNA-binding protein|nr:MAG: hypothetical protein CVV44_18950 [Spirochaetae bacterium HGW-Spirochaetae-1]